MEEKSVMVKLCPNCNHELAPAGVNRANELVYQCGSCLLRGGTILEMTRTAVDRKKRLEATASVFKCSLCGTPTPSTKINIANTFPNGELTIIHACDDCLPITATMEAKRKIRNQEDFMGGKMTKALWGKWLDGFNQGYPYLGQIKEILHKEKKID